MSLSSKKPTVEIPSYQAPRPPSFSAYGQTGSFKDGKYSVTEDPTQLADRQAAERVRRDLIGSLGLSGSESDPYAQRLLQENLRIAQPHLENSLIQRGLGGSSVYQGALTDLITKATTDAVLNSQNQKLNTLGTLQSSYFAPYEQLGQNLLQLSAQTGLSQQQLAQQLYQMQLPYKAQVNNPGNSGLGGLIQGGIGGFMAGGPIGALAGAGVGYFGSKSNAYSEPYMLSDYANKSSGLNLQSLQALLQGGRAF